MPSVLLAREIPTLYGLVSVSELLMQKIWLRQDFAQDRLQTREGKPLKIIHPGQWNRLGGPDFRGAELEIAGQRRVGDVEVHFHQRDWAQHGHARNPAFDQVILHVVVFDPLPEDPPARTSAGHAPPCFVLTPHLPEDLEAYAYHDALQQLEQRDPLDLVAPLLALSLNQRRARLRQLAHVRWQQKVTTAQRRLRRHGDWTLAAHQLALEVLGYRRNRGPMSGLAEQFPLPELARLVKADGPEATAQVLYHAEADNWRLEGQRPANHPRLRLAQYLQLVAQRPDWPTRLQAAAPTLFIADGQPGEATAVFRRRAKLTKVVAQLQEAWLAGAIPRPRFDTLVVDALLPLLAAQNAGSAATITPTTLARYWFHWPRGDNPERLEQFLRVAGVHQDVKHWPSCHGMAQGALQMLLEGNGLYFA